ncbi:MAG: glycosyltransferase family 2 protein [Clostridia bacterium]|nr:glycosyltransferase family 2 protein [Clostridia bacterium]
MKLSLIMTVCDVCEKKLDSALKAVRDSYLKNDEYELIVIDDGSTGNYDEIIKKYSPVYVKTPHRGNLSAVLYGILIAKGDYIAFTNPLVQPTFTYYKTMLDGIIDNGADISIGEIAYSEGEAKYVNKLDPVTNNEISVENEHILRFFVRDMIESESITTLYNKIFKKETLLLAKNELEKTDAFANKSFDVYGEMLLCYYAAKNAKKMVKSHTGYCFFDIDSKQTIENDEEKSATFDIILNSLPENEHTAELKKNVEFNRGIYIKNNIGFCKKAYLGNNFFEIDREIARFYKSDAKVNLIYDKKDAYVSEIIALIVKNDGKEISDSAQKLVVIPKRKISLIQKIKSVF